MSHMMMNTPVVTDNSGSIWSSMHFNELLSYQGKINYLLTLYVGYMYGQYLRTHLSAVYQWESAWEMLKLNFVPLPTEQLTSRNTTH